jgi:hypothetical protein
MSTALPSDTDQHNFTPKRSHRAEMSFGGWWSRHIVFPFLISLVAGTAPYEARYQPDKHPFDPACIVVDRHLSYHARRVSRPFWPGKIYTNQIIV